MNQAQPLSQGDLLHFCLFDPTGGGVAVQNKCSPAESKYWSLHQAPFVCEGPAQCWNIKNNDGVKWALISFLPI